MIGEPSAPVIWTCSTAIPKGIRGVDAVVHIASPVEFGGEDFRESHLKPALEGTRGVSKAVAEEKNNVKSVVYTSTYGES